MAPKADQEENKRAAMRASNRMEGYGVLFFLFVRYELYDFDIGLGSCHVSCSFARVRELMFILFKGV